MSITFRAGSATFELTQERLASLEGALARLGHPNPRLPIDPHGRWVLGSPDQIRRFAGQISALRTSYRSARVEELVRERDIGAPTPALVEQAVAPLLMKDRDLAALEDLTDF